MHLVEVHGRKAMLDAIVMAGRELPAEDQPEFVSYVLSRWYKVVSYTMSGGGPNPFGLSPM